MAAESSHAVPLSLPLTGQPAPPEGEPRDASVPVRQITILPVYETNSANVFPQTVPKIPGKGSIYREFL